MLCSLLRLKCPNTNTRIADERLYLLRPWSIVATNSDTVIFLSLAISRNASQNGVSRDTLDLCPSRLWNALSRGHLCLARHCDC
jgi:hypothetical protein